MFAVANSKLSSYQSAIKKAAAYRIKYEACKGKYTLKGKPVYPPSGKCKAYYRAFEKYRLKASDAAKEALKDTKTKAGLTPELMAELEKATKGVVDLAQSAGFIPASDAEMQAAMAEEEEDTEPAPEASDNTMLYVGAAVMASGLVMFGLYRYSRRA